MLDHDWGDDIHLIICEFAPSFRFPNINVTLDRCCCITHVTQQEGTRGKVKKERDRASDRGGGAGEAREKRPKYPAHSLRRDAGDELPGMMRPDICSFAWARARLGWRRGGGQGITISAVTCPRLTRGRRAALDSMNQLVVARHGLETLTGNKRCTSQTCSSMISSDEGECRFHLYT